MAENLDMPQIGNFSIQDTMDMGMGNQELLNDLMSPESATSNPDDIHDIKDEPAPAPTKKTTSKHHAIPDPADPAEDKKDEPVKGIQDFLYGEDEDEDSEEEKPATAPAKKATQPADNQEDSKDDNEEGEEAPTSQFTALSNDLFKLGVFSKEDEEEETAIDTPEAFLERFQAEKKKGAIEIVDNFIGQFGEDYQKAFDAIFVKGVDPKDYFGAFSQIQSFAEMDLTQENNQVAVIKQALTDQGFEPEDVITEVERLKNYGDLESVAAKHHKVLIKKEGQKLQQMDKTFKSKEQMMNNEMQDESMKKLQDVKKKITDYLAAYNKAKGYAFILGNNSDMLSMYYKDTAYDITADLVKGLNELYKAKK